MFGIRQIGALLRAISVRRHLETDELLAERRHGNIVQQEVACKSGVTIAHQQAAEAEAGVEQRHIAPGNGRAACRGDGAATANNFGRLLWMLTKASSHQEFNVSVSLR